MKQFLVLLAVMLASTANAATDLSHACGIVVSEGDGFDSKEAIAALETKGYTVSIARLQAGLPSYDTKARLTIESFGDEGKIPFHRSCSLESRLMTRSYGLVASAYSGTIEGDGACQRATLKVIEMFPSCLNASAMNFQATVSAGEPERVYCPDVAIAAATDAAWETLRDQGSNMKSQIRAFEGGSYERQNNGVTYFDTYILVNLGWGNAFGYRVKMHSLPTGNIACAVDSVAGAGFTVKPGQTGRP